MTKLFTSDPLIAQPYRGYANDHRIFLKGRVLEDEGIFRGKSKYLLRNLLDSFKRFESDEMPGAKVGVRLDENYFEIITDHEGYFTLDMDWQSPPKPSENRWLKADVQLLDAPGGLKETHLTEAEILFPSRNATYGIISDIDDTVLQTHVSYRWKWKLIYATFFLGAHQRLPMEGMPELLRAFEKGADGKRENPIFYVSDSPWNIFDLLVEFMALQQLPKGAILLRDVGMPPKIRPEGYRGHKLDSIGQILKTFPELPFIMLGDTASKDADYYLTLAQEFSNRIVAIYIRQTRDTANARRVATLIEGSSNINAVLVRSSKEILEHAARHGFLSS